MTLDQPGRLAQALLLLGDRANLLILRNAFLLGTRRFGDWRDQLAMSESVLADRLALLVSARVLSRSTPSPSRVEYRLTDAGLALWPLLVALVEWERTWSPDGDLQPPLTHVVCGSVMSPVLVCGREGVAVSARDTSVVLADPTAAAGAVPPGVRRRSGQRDPALALDTTLAVIGDRWSAVLLGLALTGVRRFGDFQRGMGAAPTVLTDRLRRLVAEDVLASVVPPGARRAEYRLTAKGRGLFPFYALLVAWSDGWLGDDGPRLMRIRHDGHDLQPRLACGACGVLLTRRRVTYAPLRS